MVYCFYKTQKEELFLKNYRFLLFDLDGTLIYSHEGIFSCIRHTLRAKNLPDPNDAILKKCVGPPLTYAFSHFFGMTEKDAIDATRIYREEYAKTGVWQNSLIPGAKEALDTFQKAGFTLALATSKPKHFAQKILDRWELSHYFKAIVGPYEGKLETKAEVIQEALRITGANEENCLMIGDRKHDLEGANANGIDCAIVLTGYAETSEFEQISPKYLFSSFEELTKTIVSK